MISEPFTVNCPLLHLILKLLLDLDLAALHRSTLVDASNYYDNFYFLGFVEPAFAGQNCVQEIELRSIAPVEGINCMDHWTWGFCL